MRGTEREPEEGRGRGRKGRVGREGKGRGDLEMNYKEHITVCYIVKRRDKA